MIYLDADIYLVDQFFDSFPQRFRLTVLVDLMQTVFDRKTFLISTGKQQLAQMCNKVGVMDRQKLVSFGDGGQ